MKYIPLPYFINLLLTPYVALLAGISFEAGSGWAWLFLAGALLGTFGIFAGTMAAIETVVEEKSK